MTVLERWREGKGARVGGHPAKRKQVDSNNQKKQFKGI